MRRLTRELAIVRRRLPAASAKLAESVVTAVNKLRGLELKQAPSISETLDWVSALVALNADTLSVELISQTLTLVLKHQTDVEKAKAQLHSLAQA